MNLKFTLLVLCTLAFNYVFSQGEATENYRAILHDGWPMQSAITDGATGAAISKPGFQSAGWYKVTVPTTVIAGLIANKVYDFDPFYSRNFEKLADPSLDN